MHIDIDTDIDSDRVNVGHLATAFGTLGTVGGGGWGR